MSEELFMTRTDFMFKYRIPYATIADRVRKKEIELHLIEKNSNQHSRGFEGVREQAHVT
jgi:hypothetical protein